MHAFSVNIGKYVFVSGSIRLIRFLAAPAKLTNTLNNEDRRFSLDSILASE